MPTLISSPDTKPRIPHDTSLSGNSSMANTRQRVYLDMDRISKIPQAIIETILCLVPIKDAARTSVLSKEWRYSWTKIPKIPKLVFNEYIFIDKTCPKNHTQSVIKLPSVSLPAICKILKMQEGTIDEFTIEMNTREWGSELDDILDYLSGKSVKKLTLEFISCSLPSSLFSLIYLTDLCLIGCALDHDDLLGPDQHESSTSTDCGSPNIDRAPICNIGSLGRLKTLHLENLTITTENLVYFLSKCPLLQTVTMLQNQNTDYDIIDNNTSTIIDMFDCLPMIENLSISSSIIECFPSIHGGPLKLPTGLVHLKYICIKDMSFVYDYEQICRLGPVLGLLLRSSPNLERLVVTLGDSESGSSAVEDFSDIWLEHLNELTIKNIKVDYKRFNTNDELKFAKLILATSPALKEVKIFIHELVDEDEKLLISKILSSSLHASPMVKIIVQR